MMPNNKDISTKSVIFFDGECVVCNRFALFVLRFDTQFHFYFAPLQGLSARQILDKEMLMLSNHTIIVWTQKEGIKTESEAIFYILSKLSFPWKILSILAIFPSKLCNWCYRYFATRRYRWFGKKECAKPNAQWKERLIP